MLIDTIKQIGQEVEYNTGEYLFRQSGNDMNLYFVVSGKLLMEKDGSFVSYIEKDTIIGEKSFLGNTPKPLDVKVVDDAKVISVSPDSFNEFSDEEKISFLKEIAIYVSERVNSLTQIMNHVDMISQKIYEFDGDDSLESLSSIFGTVLELEKVVIFRKEYGVLSKVLGGVIEDELQKEAEKYIEKDFQFYTDENRLFMVESDYFLGFVGIKKMKDYVVNNIFLNITPALRIFVEKIEKQKLKKVSDYLNL